MLRRIVNRYNGEVNGYFLCDRGRFGYEFVNSAKRVREPLLRQNGELKPAPNTDVLDHLKGFLRAGRVIGIGSPRASLEANFALRAFVGAEKFFSGFSSQEHRLAAMILSLLRSGPARTPSLREIEQSDAVLVLGEDVTQTAPRMALALRQSVRQQPFQVVEKLRIPLWLDHAVREAVQEQKGPFFVTASHATKLDDIATETYRASPDSIARLGFAVAHELDTRAPEVTGISKEAQALAGRIAAALKNAQRPLVLSGPSLNDEAILRAAAAVAWALCRAGKLAGLTFTAPECNSVGLAMMEPRPLREALDELRKSEADTLVILENDLYRRGSKPEIDELLGAARHIVAIDSLVNATTERAEAVLPAGTFAESDGTLVNQEGRAQRFFQVFVPQGEIQESWRWLRDLMLAAGQREGAAWETLDHVEAALAETLPALAPAMHAAPPSTFREAGAKIPREPQRYSGRTAKDANVNVSEPKPPEDPDSALSFTMEGYPEQPPSPLIPFFWSPGWNSIQSVNKFQEEIAGPLRGGDPGVRLIAPGQGGESLGAGQEASPLRSGEWLVVPLYHAFGSEELSAEAQGVAELIPAPYVALNRLDAERLQLQEGGQASLALNGSVLRLPVRIHTEMPEGLAGLPAGLPGMEPMSLPAPARISKA